MPMELFIDARSVFDSVTSKTVTTPADGALLIHAKALREYLNQGQLRGIWWIDTRDMIADALNKGSIDRTALRAIFTSGIWKLAHEAKYWQAPKPLTFPSTGEQASSSNGQS